MVLLLSDFLTRNCNKNQNRISFHLPVTAIDQWSFHHRILQIMHKTFKPGIRLYCNLTPHIKSAFAGVQYLFTD
jgi:hypothetical protein